MRLNLLLTIVVVLAPQVPATGPAPQTPPKMIEIDGRKTPEEIPQYLMWESAFRFLARLPSVDDLPPRSGIDIQVFLSRADLALVTAESKAQLTAQIACAASGNARLDELRRLKRSDQEIYGDLASLIIACREESIKSGERLTARLSEHGRTYFTKWLLDFRGSISASVAESELGFFRRPR